jgi:hypothetical protein
MTTRFTRRRFLQTATVAAGSAAVASTFAAPAVLSEKSPNSKLGVVVIGVANQGIPSVNAACGEQLVAMVDVDEKHLADTTKWIGEKHPDVNTASIQRFYDYRKMFDKIHKDIDAVFIAVPDHHHAVASLNAMRLGKHVYCEKPMAHSIGEVRLMVETARKYKVMTQLGNQGHSGESIRLMCEYVWAGAIGNVTETHSWARTGRGGIGGRLPTLPVPAGLHWEEWIGPAAYRDYHEKLHPKLWRSWWEFGDGSVGDWGCHNLDGVFMSLKLSERLPTSVEAIEQVGGSDERFPLRNVLRWNYPAHGELSAVKVHWYDGFMGAVDALAKLDENNPEGEHNRPALVDELEKKYGRKLGDGGVILVGDKGILVAGNYCGSPRLVPEEKQKQYGKPPHVLERVKKGLTHQTDFLRSCRDGKPASSNFDYSGPLTEMALLGCLAERAGLGRHVEWDAAKMEVTNLPELNRMVKREYRKGWELG